MWNPLSWVMEAAAVMAIALANGARSRLARSCRDYLPTNNQLHNNAGNAASALMARLAPKTRSAFTGESLPVTKRTGDELLTLSFSSCFIDYIPWILIIHKLTKLLEGAQSELHDLINSTVLSMINEGFLVESALKKFKPSVLMEKLTKLLEGAQSELHNLINSTVLSMINEGFLVESALKKYKPSVLMEEGFLVESALKKFKPSVLMEKLTKLLEGAQSELHNLINSTVLSMINEGFLVESALKKYKPSVLMEEGFLVESALKKFKPSVLMEKLSTLSFPPCFIYYIPWILIIHKLTKLLEGAQSEFHDLINSTVLSMINEGFLVESALKIFKPSVLMEKVKNGIELVKSLEGVESELHDLINSTVLSVINELSTLSFSPCFIYFIPWILIIHKSTKPLEGAESELHDLINSTVLSMINENFLVESALKKFPHYVLMEEVKNGIEREEQVVEEKKEEVEISYPKIWCQMCWIDKDNFSIMEGDDAITMKDSCTMVCIEIGQQKE
ncbi:hypothetical protein G4B88_010545 [Cannabis sativa]|uniref:Uncharacterized protein n=1 Tax=Cannabis sativa TaxID=3483 RepID=A0A7J6G852_CANSA|nr:hypothetical protein G4B88_010545 [Cannabis sativa]